MDLNGSTLFLNTTSQVFTNEEYVLTIKRNSDTFLGFYVRTYSLNGDDASTALYPASDKGHGGSSWISSRGVVTCDSGVSAITHIDSSPKSVANALLQMNYESSIMIEVFVMVNLSQYYYDNVQIDVITRQPITTSSLPTPSNPIQSTSPSIQTLSPSNDIGCISTDPMYQNMVSLDNDLILFWNLTDTLSTFLHARLQYKGKGWIGFGFSNNGLMIGNNAIIGTMESEPRVLKYKLSARRLSGIELLPEANQTLQNVVFEQTESETNMTFSKLLQEDGEITIDERTIFIWSYGSSNILSTHIAQGSYIIDLSQCSQERNATFSVKNEWKAHGIMMFVSWGVLVPLAIAFQILRRFSYKYTHIHVSLNLSAYLSVIASFIISIITTDNQKLHHFDGKHQVMGFALIVVASLQVMGGITRPHANREIEITKTRKYWECVHKSSGYILLVFSSLVILSGLERYSEKYGKKSYCVEFILYMTLIVVCLILVKLYCSKSLHHRRDNGVRIEEAH